MRFSEIISEDANPKRQAAIAIAMKKAGKKPKKVTEYVDHNLIQKWNEYNLSIIDKVKKLGDMLYSTTDYKNKIDFDDIDYEDMGISKEKFQKHINQYIHKQQLTLLNFWHEKKELELNTELTLDDKIEEVHQLYNDLLTDLKKLGFPVSVLKDKEDTEGVAEGLEQQLVTIYTNPAYKGATVDDRIKKSLPVTEAPFNKLQMWENGKSMKDPKVAQWVNNNLLPQLKQNGKLGPLVVWNNKGKLFVIDGNHRFIAYQAAGYNGNVPVQIVPDKMINIVDTVPGQQGVAEGSLNELSSRLLQKAALAATDKRNQAMEPELHNALGGGYMNPLAKHYDNVSQKMDNRAAQVKRKETIQNIASKIASPAVMRKMGMSGVAEGSDELYQKAIRKYVQQVAHDYLGGGNAHLYGANKFDSEMFGVSQEQAKQDFKTLFPQALKQLQGVAEGENWSKHNNPRAGGMSKKSVSSYRRSHPGSKIQTAVTTKPSKLKKGSKAAARRKSFCARMRGMKKHRTGAKTAHDPNSNINKSLRRWHCESIEELHELVMLAEQYIRNNKK